MMGLFEFCQNKLCFIRKLHLNWNAQTWLCLGLRLALLDPIVSQRFREIIVSVFGFFLSKNIPYINLHFATTKFVAQVSLINPNQPIYNDNNNTTVFARNTTVFAKNTIVFTQHITVFSQNTTVFAPNTTVWAQKDYWICKTYHRICPKYNSLFPKYHMISPTYHCIRPNYHCIFP